MEKEKQKEGRYEKRHYLALADQIDFNDQKQTKTVLVKMIWLEIILQICYQAYPFVTKYLIGNRVLKDVFVAIYLIVFTMATLHFGLTTKVFDKRVKTHRAVKVLTAVYFVLLGLMVVMNIFTHSMVFKLPGHKIVSIALIALSAAICEEFLFRGILFNIFTVALRKNKYNIFWTSVICSVLFGLFHLINLFHQPLVSTIGQIIFAMALGFILSYLRILSNGIIFGIIVHFLQDCSPQVASSNTGNSNIAFVSAVYIPVSIFMMICIYLFNRQLNKK